jgi:hypothetical protein
MMKREAILRFQGSYLRLLAPFQHRKLLDDVVCFNFSTYNRNHSSGQELSLKYIPQLMIGFIKSRLLNMGDSERPDSATKTVTAPERLELNDVSYQDCLSCRVVG